MCASVTQAVSAISYRRRRNRAMFPRLHSEDQGDVQDRLRVPGGSSRKAEAAVWQRFEMAAHTNIALFFILTALQKLLVY